MGCCISNTLKTNVCVVAMAIRVCLLLISFLRKPQPTLSLAVSLFSLNPILTRLLCALKTKREGHIVPPPPPHNTIKTANEGRFRLNVDSPYGERAHSTALTREPPRPRQDFIFNLSMRESKASPVVVCLHHAGGRRHFRLGVSSSVGHCCQHFWVGWEPNRIKNGLRRGKCQRDKQALQIFLGRLQLDDAAVFVYKGSKTPRHCCRAVGRACFGCAWSVVLVTSINMAGGACKCGVGSLVHRRKFDRSHSDAAVLCAGVSFSLARPLCSRFVSITRTPVLVKLTWHPTNPTHTRTCTSSFSHQPDAHPHLYLFVFHKIHTHL